MDLVAVLACIVLMLLHFLIFVTWRNCCCQPTAKKFDEKEMPQFTLHASERFYKKREESWMLFMTVVRHSPVVIFLARLPMYALEDPHPLPWYRPFGLIFVYVALIAYPAIFIWAGRRRQRAEEGRNEGLFLRAITRPNAAYFFMSFATGVVYGGALYAYQYSHHESMVNMNVFAIHRMVFGAVNRKTFTSIVVNIGLSLLVLASIMHVNATNRGNTASSAGALNWDMEQNQAIAFGYTSFMEIWGIVAMEIYHLVLIIVVSFISEQQALEAAFNATCAWNERLALSSILNASCDVVMRLDDNACISGHTPKLAALLLRDTRAPAMDGEPLENLLAPSVDDIAKKHIADMFSTQTVDRGGEQIASAFTMDLHDRLRNVVPVRGFHTRLIDLDGSPRHLVGLSENEFSGEKHRDFSRTMQYDNTFAKESGRSHSHSTFGGTEHIGTGSSSRSRHSGHSDSIPDSIQEEATASQRHWSLAFPSGFETSDAAKQWSMAKLMFSWNIRIPSDSCCHMHSALQDVRVVADLLGQRGCVTSCQPSAPQCPSCGLMNGDLGDAGPLCETCREICNQLAGDDDLSGTGSTLVGGRQEAASPRSVAVNGGAVSL